ELDETWLAGGWEPLLRHWIEQATAVGIAEPNAMVLATVTHIAETPRPLTRTVLCKGLSPEGVTFYTNYDSANGAQLTAVPRAPVTHVAEPTRPVTRTVLCKGLSPEGVTFYTSYDSAKWAELTAVPFASATFVWPALGRQVHLRGPVERVPAETIAAYWRSRP